MQIKEIIGKFPIFINIYIYNSYVYKTTLDPERSEKYIDSTMMRVFFFSYVCITKNSSRKSAPIFTVTVCFQWHPVGRSFVDFLKSA